MNFEFATATRIVFGPGKIREAGTLMQNLGRRAVVVTGRNIQRAAPLLRSLEASGISVVFFPVPSEPTLDLVRQGVVHARTGRCDCVIGFGGGSVIDAAKAVAILLTHPGDVLDYLEVVGRGQPLTQAGVPFAAIPTTAGTGAEVTRNAVLGSPEHRVKASLRSPLMLAKLALVDPELTLDLPRDLTANSGLDALTQLIEPFVSVRANPLTDACCRDGLPRAARSLQRAFEAGHDLAVREDMALASLLSGLALANAALGAVHGFAAALGGMFSVPHGAVCAALLPHVMEVNLDALRARQPASDAIRRFDEIARVLTNHSEAKAEDGIAWVRKLCAALSTPSLRKLSVPSSAFAEIAQKASQASSMKGNPLPLTPAELTQILERAH